MELLLFSGVIAILEILSSLLDRFDLSSDGISKYFF